MCRLIIEKKILLLRHFFMFSLELKFPVTCLVYEIFVTSYWQLQGIFQLNNQCQVVVIGCT